ncbi:MAG TPA: glycosyltransferase [Candidatus Limnocylindrales bacterium]|nr:glycosyltransferase [Candidatus Limnocylindrales bacterium]
MAERSVRVVQLGDVASVAPALAAALGDVAEVISIPLPQRGAHRRGPVKVLYGPLRLIDAARVARAARALRPDVVHVHWVPNGVVGLMVGVPWVLHAHGSDIRDLDPIRRHSYGLLVRAATCVVYATPDLARWVLPLRPDAEHLPVAIPIRSATGEADLDVLLASRAAPSKGSGVAAAAVAILRRERADLRIAAVDGPDFSVDAIRLPFGPKATFLERLGRARVVVGQFRVPALGVSELEAMSMARPVVTNVDVRLYPDPPPVVVAEDAAAVARAVGRLLDDPSEAEEVGEAGQRWVRSWHSPDAVATRVLAVYRRAIATRGAGAR